MSVGLVQNRGLLTVLSTDRSWYRPGQPVRISLLKINISPFPITLTYNTSQRYDFAVYGLAGEVWRWSFDRLFLPVVQTVILNPGESAFYTEVWPQINSFGVPVSSGMYRITGWNTARETSAFQVPSVLIRVLG